MSEAKRMNDYGRSKPTWYLTSTETIRLIRDGETVGGRGGGGMEVGGEGDYVYLSLHCHHQNDSCIKMGSDESHYNVSVQSPQTTTFLRSGIKPRSFHLPA